MDEISRTKFLEENAAPSQKYISKLYRTGEANWFLRISNVHRLVYRYMKMIEEKEIESHDQFIPWAKYRN